LGRKGTLVVSLASYRGPMGSERWDEIGYTRGFAKVRDKVVLCSPAFEGSKPKPISMPFFVLVFGVIRATSSGAQSHQARSDGRYGAAQWEQSGNRTVGQSERSKETPKAGRHQAVRKRRGGEDGEDGAKRWSIRMWGEGW
jgi:hypothetical protein